MTESVTSLKAGEGSTTSLDNINHGSGTVAADGEQGPGEDPVPHLHAKTFVAIFAVCLIYYAQLINLVGCGAQTQNITNALGGNSASAVWLSSPIAIMTVVLSPIVSQAADYWGRRWFLVGLTFCGAIGSAVVARSTSMPMAVAGFTITGISYGAQPLLHAVSSEVLPRRYRSWGQAADLVSNALGGITALLVGGALTRNSKHPGDGFRYYWYMAMAIFLFASVLTAFLYNPPKTEKQLTHTLRQKLAQLDFVGYALLTAGLVLFCMGLSWSQDPYPWTDAHPTAPFAVGLFLVLLLVVYETRFRRDGMFHHGLFRDRNFAICLCCIFCEGFAFFGANQYFAFETSVLYEPDDNLLVGVRFSVSMLVSIVSAPLAGVFVAATGRVRWITVSAFVLFVAFYAGMAAAGPSSSSAVWGLTVLLGSGLGISLCALITVAQLSTPKELIAITSGLVISMRSLGGSVGLAIYNALLVNQLSHLGDNIAAAVLPAGLPESSLGAFIGALTAQNETAMAQVPGVTPQVIGAGATALLDTYSHGFSHIWILACAFTALAGILAIFLIDPRKEFTMHIDAPVEKEADMYSLH